MPQSCEMLYSILHCYKLQLDPSQSYKIRHDLTQPYKLLHNPIRVDFVYFADVDTRCKEFDNGTSLHIAASNLCLEGAKCLVSFHKI